MTLIKEALSSSAMARNYWPARSFATEVLSVRGWHTGLELTGGNDIGCEECQMTFSSSTIETALRRAALHIQRDGLVAFPTETVYGLGGSALSEDATQAIFAAKGRPADNPLIVHIADLAMLRTVTPPNFYMPSIYQALIGRFWPGPLTLLFPVGVGQQSRPSVASAVTCGHPTMAVRMPSNPVARALIALSNLPLAAPSANISGRPSPTSAEHVAYDLGSLGRSLVASKREGRIQFILDGGTCDFGVESTVVDCITAPGELRILRPGGVNIEEIEETLRIVNDAELTKIRMSIYGQSSMSSDVQHLQESAPTTPGMKYRHYSPNAPVILAVPDKEVSTHSRLDGMKRLLSTVTTLATRARHVTSENCKPLRIGVMSSPDSWLLNNILDLGCESTSTSARYASSDWTTDQSTTARTREWLVSVKEASLEFDANDHIGPSFTINQKSEGGSHTQSLQIVPFSLGMRGRPESAAQRLFGGFRSLDQDTTLQKRCEIIVVEGQHEAGIWHALLNRLRKAASVVVVV